MSDDLRPCPFCGGEAKAFQFENENAYVTCQQCSGKNSVPYPCKDAAIVAWNRRAAMPSPVSRDAIKEALRNSLIQDISEWPENDLDDLLEELQPYLQSQPQPLPVSEWQDIATAPRDGRNFLACMFTDRSKRRALLHTVNDGLKAVKVADSYMIFQLRWDDDADSFVDVLEGESVKLEHFNYWQDMPVKPKSAGFDIVRRG